MGCERRPMACQTPTRVLQNAQFCGVNGLISGWGSTRMGKEDINRGHATIFARMVSAKSHAGWVAHCLSKISQPQNNKLPHLQNIHPPLAAT